MLVLAQVVPVGTTEQAISSGGLHRWPDVGSWVHACSGIVGSGFTLVSALRSLDSHGGIELWRAFPTVDSANHAAGQERAFCHMHLSSVVVST